MKRLVVLALLFILLFSSCTSTTSSAHKAQSLNSEALSLLRAKEYEGAISKLKEALNLDVQQSELHYNLVFALLAQGSYEQAIKNSNASFALFPAHLEFPLAQAYALRELGEVEAAFIRYEEILALDEGNYPLRATLAELALDLGQEQFAHKHALFLLYAHKEETRALQVLASLEGEESWYAAALSLRKEASEEDLK